VSSGGREFALVVAAGVIALGGGLGGAWIGANAANRNQRDEAREARQAEARQKRADVYSDFLDAAGAYAGRSREIQTKITAVTQRNLRPGQKFTAVRRFERTLPWRGCPSRVSALPVGSEPFQGALNDVYVYGSARGVSAARRVAAALPPSLFDPQTVKLGGVIEARFKRAYSTVLDTMCAEVSVDPRQAC
jgi:hypothetical protein